MMELIADWLLGITCVAMVVALAEGLSPDGGVKRVGRLVGGLVLMLAIVAPVSKLDYATLSRLLAAERAEAAGYEYAVEGANKDLIKTIIAQQSAAYISDKAVSLGLGQCEVEVTCRYDDGEFPVPVAVRVCGAFTAEQAEMLGRAIEADFAIPRAEQTMERTGET